MAAKLAEVVPGIYEIFLPLPMRPTIINVYLIDCAGAWALVDTGMNSPESIATLEDAFAQVGIGVKDLDVIVATHHHVDHFGASAELRERSKAAVYVHQAEAARADMVLTFGRMAPGEHPEAREFFQRHGFPIDRYPIAGIRPAWVGTEMYNPVIHPDRYLHDGDVVKLGERKLEIIWTPGHAPGHCVIYLRKEKTLIVGDHLLPKITPHVGIYPDTSGDPLGDFINSQRKVQKFDVETVLPAHGGVYRDHRHRANQLIEHHRYREAEMLDLAKNKAQSSYEISEQIFGDKDLPVYHVMAATFETLAHLEHAHLEGRARKIERDGRILFQTA